jgi:hypothetical protein
MIWLNLPFSLPTFLQPQSPTCDNCPPNRSLQGKVYLVMSPWFLIGLLTRPPHCSFNRLILKMQRVLLSLSLLASAAVGVLASDDLKIDVTLPVECDRKTQKGDTINVHYRGTLQSNGQKFDASQSRALPLSSSPGPSSALRLRVYGASSDDGARGAACNTCANPLSGYDRGAPFSFQLGAGMVIKG